ncbi:phosphonopyruvate decarboxylase [Streptomyces profundus]|uniref:phosphonopyruvate decarboxylase n=1 Tax=Streptomyces profundus TaxID=2867410 RepID=UPI001D168CCC|nr:phosphonopyruvate decarboxylase [Streptomyces sp. MA3_2.13]UED87557.1 phosphonopyruvate decarboxylase [Streptomyces sp. MA3_2.13]
MISAEDFCALLEARGYTTASGVPCSHFGGPIALLGAREGRYVPAPNEGSALAVAAGAALAGRRAYVMLQNSGLGNLINPLTSLVMMYRLPVLTFTSLRGWPDAATDEPQHAVMGPATPRLLDALGTPHHILREDGGPAAFEAILDATDGELAAGRAPFVLVERGAIGGVAVEPPAGKPGLTAAHAIRVVTKALPEALVIATTGYTGRDAFAVADRPGAFYMQGSMGHAPSLALGVALAHPERTVVVLDGDGALLMHLGALSMIGHLAPPNLVHVVLDNGVHESTGGQPTTSSTTSFTEAALAAGYVSATSCAREQDLARAVGVADAAEGPALVRVPTLPRTGEMPPRATAALGPEAMRDRFLGALGAAEPPRS